MLPAGGEPVLARQRRFLELALEAFGPLVGSPSIAAEARLRRGYLLFQLDRFQEALGELQSVPEETDDAFLKYLAHFYRGRVLEVLGDQTGAAAGYRAALVVLPRAPSASAALAALRFRLGDPGEAAAVVASLLAADRIPDDPWLLYGYGDYRFYEARRLALQRALRKS